jgi:hypothetical protein
MGRYAETEEFRGAEFVDLDMTGAQFREVDLSGARMYGVLLTGADLDGDITGLRVNGVEVAPLVEAELDRQHPERIALRATEPAGLREAVAVVVAMWAPTIERARALPAADLDRSVNDEWSFVETLRHLVFVIDTWFGSAILGRASFSPVCNLPAFLHDHAAFGLDPAASPSLDEVVAAHSERLDQIREFLATASQTDLDRPRDPNPDAGWPPPGARPPLRCLHTVLNEEWTHHQFAVRDLAIIEAEGR